MRVAVATLGCKVNQYDSAVFGRLFGERGWQRVGFDDQADAYVVNSCTVTDRADADARRLARRARRRNPQARVIMTGCYAQATPAAVSALAEVDYVIGLGRLADLLSAVEGELAERVAVSDLRKSESVDTFGIETFPGRSRAFVKVQEGCDLFCSFCIIPIARGASRSVKPRRVLDEITRLEASGYGEIVLTGVHLGGYGRDLDPATDLVWLLEAAAEQATTSRIRLSSIDPPEISRRLVSVVASNNVFCDHFHVPLQAGDDRTLERMRRRYDTEQAAAAIEMLRADVPDLCLGTDIITGFPGETDEEFENTLRFIERIEPAYLHVFPYSKRHSTAAAKRWQEVPSAVARERAKRLRTIDADLRRRYEERFVGQTLDVLFEGASDARSETELAGRTSNYLRIRVAGSRQRAGRRARVLVCERSTSGLIGRLL